MNEIANTFNEVDELRGRLLSIMVNYPDTEVRMRPAIEVLYVLLVTPSQPMVQQAIGELIELRQYFADIIDKHDQMLKPFQPSIELIDRLLGPNETVH